MSGRQAKRARREAGVSIPARRAERDDEAMVRAFAQELLEWRATRAVQRARSRRRVIVWCALAALIVATAAAAGALFL